MFGNISLVIHLWRPIASRFLSQRFNLLKAFRHYLSHVLLYDTIEASCVVSDSSDHLCWFAMWYACLTVGAECKYILTSHIRVSEG